MSCTVISTPEGIQVASFLALRGALKLEIKGLTRRGPSVYEITKSRLGLTLGRASAQNRVKALNAITAKVRELWPEYTPND